MQDRLHHGPYRLGPSQRCILFLDPGIERGKLRGLQANSYQGSFSGGGRPPALLCYHGVTFHKNCVITKASRGEGRNFRPGSNPSHKDIRGALAADDALKRQGLAIRFRVRETPDWKKHAADLESEMLKRGMRFDVIDWSEDQPPH